MSRVTTHALLADAFHQVLDNRMFRLLVLVTITLVAPTFLIGFEEDGINLLFGFREISYESLLRNFGSPIRAGDSVELRILVVQRLQELFVDNLVGRIGVLFCIAATAFFLPQALEKGTAEIVFAQPVSRIRILIARYFAGVLFVGVLATLLVVGMHTGLLLMSGYSDPGFLWSIFTLVYLFAILHAFSICVGVFTKSSVTALLSAMMFFVFTGCVQGMWAQKERAFAHNAVEELRKQLPPGVELPDEAAGEPEGDERSPVEKFLLTTLDTSHWILPKTRDAGVLSRKMRRALESAPEFEDEESGLVLLAPPEGFEQEASGRLDGEGVLWQRGGSGELPPDTIRLVRIPRREDRGEDKSPRFLFPGSLARALADEIQESPTEVVEAPSVTSGHLSEGTATNAVSWVVSTGDGPEDRRRRETHFFPADKDWMMRVEADFAAASEAEPEPLLDEFLDEIQLPSSVGLDWYEQQMAFDAPLRYNLFFSVATSCVFALLMLALAAWRLLRIDF